MFIMYKYLYINILRFLLCALNDDKNREIYSKDLKINKNGELEIEIQPNGGFVLK